MLANAFRAYVRLHGMHETGQSGSFRLGSKIPTGKPKQNVIMSLHLKLATFIMRSASNTARFGWRQCNTPAFVESGSEPSIATLREFEDGLGFFRPFEGLLSVRDFNGKDVLDLGCGHGGRTAYYALEGDPRSIVGVEITPARIRVAFNSARRLCSNKGMLFAAGVGEALPFQSESFDAIVSYDVFEHVGDLQAVLRECHRVLRRGGRLYALFPPYYGPRAHHLDFVTTLPFLHHVFRPRVLVDAANRILQERPNLRDSPLPAPSRSYLGREVLPRLNGTTERDFRRLVFESPFKIDEIALLPFAWGPGGTAKRAVRAFCRVMLSLPWPFTRDLFVGTIRCILRK